jgi:hypothetical protein
MKNITLICCLFLASCYNNTYDSNSSTFQKITVPTPKHEEKSESQKYSEKLKEAQKNLPALDRKIKEQAKTANFGPYPKNYKKLIQEYMKNHLLDPGSVRYRFFLEPVKVNAISAAYLSELNSIIESKGKSFVRNGTILPDDPDNYIFCYRVPVYINAKNTYGGFTGEQVYIFYIKNSKIIGELSKNSWGYK